MKHPIKKGPDGGRFQCSKKRGAEPRYLLDGNRKVHTGPQGGHYQKYKGNKKRYLLEY